MVEDRISGTEDKHLDTTLFQENSEKRTKKNEETLRVMWDTIKSKNLRVIGIPEQGEKTENTERITEKLLTENFPNIMKDEKLAIQEAQRTPYRRDPKRKSPRHIIFTLAKTKDKES